jgi:hypothetical protein
MENLWMHRTYIAIEAETGFCVKQCWPISTRVLLGGSPSRIFEYSADSPKYSSTIREYSYQNK